MSSFDLKNYKIINKIGFGAFGEVFKVENKKTKQIYAAKISTKTLDQLDEGFKKNFEREVSIIAKVNHPSILKFIGLSMTGFKNDNKPILVTDFLPNGSLDDILSSSHNGLPPEQWNDTLKLINIYGIASAMAFLHAHNIIHRDLKPANILLDQYLFPVLADFGLSKVQSIEESTVDIKGTPLYIAPEIWEDTVYSKEADVYSYAYILYEIYANEKPFRDITIFKLSKKICNGERPDTSCIEDPIKNLIERCWKQEPSERPTFEEIVQELEENSDFITSDVEEADFQSYVDFIKNSPKSVDETVQISEFNTTKTKVIKKVNLKKKRLYPKSDYNTLPESAQNLVDEAIDDPDKQYEVGSNLVYGKNDFPTNCELGVKYLKKSIEGGNIDSVILYNRLLIIGKKIEGNNKLAKTNLKKYEYLKNPEITFLQSMAEKKDENNEKALKLLKRSIRGGCAEAMFEYGKILYNGELVDEDQEKALEYFTKAKENGCTKVDKFIKSQKIQESSKNSKNKTSEKQPKTDKKQEQTKSTKPKSQKTKQKYDKFIDLVILIDGSNSNKYFYNALKSTFDGIARECIEENPKIYFRFGVVIYRDYSLSMQRKSKSKLYPFIINLTDDIEEVTNFLNNHETRSSSIRYANDWNSGYYALLNKIEWDEEAEKIVVQMCHVPGHGSSFTIKRIWHDKYLRIPRYNPNFSFKKNLGIYKKMQQNDKGRLFARICLLAKKNVKFYCLNGNEVALYCFKKVSNVFLKKGGKKFYIKDLFGYSYEKLKRDENNDNDDDDDDDENNNENDNVDMEELKDQVDQFFSNVIKSCVENINDDDDDDENDFERKCKQQFTADLNKFFRENDSAPYRSTETTETDDDASLTGGSDNDDFVDIDIEDDDVDENDSDEDSEKDDSDDDDDGYVKKTSSRVKNSSHGYRSTPNLPNYRRGNNDHNDDDSDGDDDDDGDERPGHFKSPKLNRKNPSSSAIPRGNNNNRSPRGGNNNRRGGGGRGGFRGGFRGKKHD